MQDRCHLSWPWLLYWNLHAMRKHLMTCFLARFVTVDNPKTKRVHNEYLIPLFSKAPQAAICISSRVRRAWFWNTIMPRGDTMTSATCSYYNIVTSHFCSMIRLNNTIFHKIVVIFSNMIMQNYILPTLVTMKLGVFQIFHIQLTLFKKLSLVWIVLNKSVYIR